MLCLRSPFGSTWLATALLSCHNVTCAQPSDITFPGLIQITKIDGGIRPLVDDREPAEIFLADGNLAEESEDDSQRDRTDDSCETRTLGFCGIGVGLAEGLFLLLPALREHGLHFDFFQDLRRRFSHLWYICRLLVGLQLGQLFFQLCYLIVLAAVDVMEDDEGRLMEIAIASQGFRGWSHGLRRWRKRAREAESACDGAEPQQGAAHSVAVVVAAAAVVECVCVAIDCLHS
eukprot:CAMPEP_0198118812 /NCGR_PEP_ID=MMETSP1442-20131203/23170_1 /TAXON_ID= /ORGANISM="Craspedostauros australis, Strain CCMP3328" /LENGTH=231 /DNA_ID=CAMNT_0043777133 /DNA_START=118 /DNA_END=810 /DNA_ORIENTATION=-